MATQLTPNNLVSERDSLYFGLLAAVAAVIWILIIVSIVGIAYAAGFALFLWFANGLFVARIRAESVEATQSQFADLYRTFSEVCSKLEISTIPRIFVLQAEGALNAFATRHSGRDFVVIYSSLYESLGAESDEMRFLIGHEIGHIRRKHLLWRLLLMPALWIPLLSAAYHRATEQTCDRFGTFAAGSVEAAARALAILTAGDRPGREVDLQRFAEQYSKERGFFVSWHELNSTYPTLSQRTYNVLSLKDRVYPQRAGRNPLSYLFALLFSRASLVAVLIIYFAAVAALTAQKGKVQKQTASAQSEYHASEQAEDEEFSAEADYE